MDRKHKAIFKQEISNLILNEDQEKVTKLIRMDKILMSTKSGKSDKEDKFTRASRMVGRT